MKGWRAALKKLLFPGWRRVCLLVLLGGASLYLTFCVFGDRSPFAYVSYVLSAYALTVLTAAAVPLLSSVRQLVHRVPLAHRYMTDPWFQARSGLLLSLLVNLCYAGFKLAYGVRYVSLWDGGLAVYHLCLCAVRVYLIRSVPLGRQRPDRMQELRVYRATGFFLLVLDLPLGAIATQIVRDGRSYDYPGTLIYAVALHAFYSLALAVVNMVKYRKFNSPVLPAAKTVNLTTALVSIFNLETAMLLQFGAGQALFRRIMTSCTAFAVCVTVAGLAGYMVISASKQMRGRSR